MYSGIGVSQLSAGAELLRVQTFLPTAPFPQTGATLPRDGGGFADASAGVRACEDDQRGGVTGIDTRLHSGLPVDNSFIGAELSSFGGTVGFSIPSGRVEWRPTVRYSMGTLTTQLVSTNMSTITAGLTISAR